MDFINRIIRESINNFLISEGIFEKNPNSDAPEQDDELSARKRWEEENNERKPLKKKKRKGNRSEWYNYDEYKKFNPNISDSDSEEIKNVIDREHTNIAAVARDVYPDHTPEGAQAQLDKQLKGDRKMTTTVVRKLSKMIDSGKIAVK